MNVIAKSNIQHDGQLYTKGQELDVTEKQAADLLAAGSIEAVQGVQPSKPDETDRNTGDPDDVNEINKNTEEVANLPIKPVGMKKTTLVGIARANGLVVEKTATPSEVYNMIKAFREKGAKVEDPEKTDEGAEGAVNTTPAK